MVEAHAMRSHIITAPAERNFPVSDEHQERSFRSMPSGRFARTRSLPNSRWIVPPLPGGRVTAGERRSRSAGGDFPELARR